MDGRQRVNREGAAPIFGLGQDVRVVLRPAELAGAYYPDTAAACRAALDGWPALEADATRAVGAIVPHGGWRYAGRILGGTLKALAARSAPDLLVVLGGHLEATEPPRVFIEGDWSTPLGPVPTPTRLAEDLAMALSAEPETAEEYYDDNAVEVLMPAIAGLFRGCPALVVGVPPDADPGPIAEEIRALAAARGYAAPGVVGSIDLTHYGPDHRFRPRGGGPEAHRWVLEDNDAALLAHVADLDAHRVAWEGPRRRNTCSAGAAAVALALARKLGAGRGQILAHSTSWLEDDRPAGVASFVGYAGVLLVDADGRTAATGGAEPG